MDYHTLKAKLPDLKAIVKAAEAEAEAEKAQRQEERWQEKEADLLARIAGWNIETGPIQRGESEPYVTFGEYRLTIYRGAGQFALKAWAQCADASWIHFKIPCFQQVLGPPGLQGGDHKHWVLLDYLDRLDANRETYNAKIAESNPAAEQDVITPITPETFHAETHSVAEKHHKLLGHTGEAAVEQVKAFLDKAAIAYTPDQIAVTDRIASFPFGDICITSQWGQPVQVWLKFDHQGIPYTLAENIHTWSPFDRGDNGLAGHELERLHLLKAEKRLREHRAQIEAGAIVDTEDWTKRSILSLFQELCERAGVDIYDE